jgi:hypothetical protein
MKWSRQIITKISHFLFNIIQTNYLEDRIVYNFSGNSIMLDSSQYDTLVQQNMSVDRL